MIKNTALLKRKFNETEHLQVIVESMHLHSLLRISNYLEEIKESVIVSEFLFDINDDLLNNPKINIQQTLRPTLKKNAKDFYLILGSNKGFCGSYNEKINKMIKEIPDDAETFIFGKRLHTKEILENMSEHEREISLQDLEKLYKEKKILRELCTNIVSKYIKGQYKSVKIIYNQYENVSAYKSVESIMLPFTNSKKSDKKYYDFELEKSQVDVFFKESLEEWVFLKCYSAVLSSLAVETLQRNMITKSAKDKLEEEMENLIRNKNRLRGDKITSETNDINNSILQKKKKRSNDEGIY